MKSLGKSALIGAIATLAVFGATYLWRYTGLMAHQPGVVPLHQATSYPPSAAWLFAAPWALIAFIATTACAFLVSKRTKKENSSGPEAPQK